MKKLIIGIVLVLFGVPGTSIFFPNILQLILGALPALLILGGGLAVYLGSEEVRSQKEMDALSPVPDAVEDKTHNITPDTKETEATATATWTEPSKAPGPPIAMVQADPPASPEPAPKTEPETQPEPTFAGNTTSLVFHSLSCTFSKGKKCTARFTSREEAITQGYKPCKVCTP